MLHPLKPLKRQRPNMPFNKLLIANRSEIAIRETGV